MTQIGPSECCKQPVSLGQSEWLRAPIRDQRIVAPAGPRVPLRNAKYGRAQLRGVRRFRPSFADHLVFDAAGSDRIQRDARLDRKSGITGAKTATERAHAIWKRKLSEFEPPPVDASVAEALDDFAARRTAAPRRWIEAAPGA